MIKDLNEAVKLLENDNDVRVIIITGEGEKSFVAGADISEFIDFNKEQGCELSANGHTILFSIELLDLKSRLSPRLMVLRLAEVLS